MDKVFHIERLSVNDIASIQSLFSDVFCHEPWNDDWSDPGQLRKYVLDIIGNPNSLSLGFYQDGELLGISLGSLLHWYSGTEYYIKEFCIARGDQDKGLGSIFLQQMESYLLQEKISFIILSTDLDKPAYHFYLKNSFEELPMTRFLHKKLSQDGSMQAPSGTSS